MMNPEDKPPLHLTVESHVARLVIDRPARRNALSLSMWSLFPDLVDEAVRQGARAVILTGGGHDFSAGADIGEFDTVRRDAATARRYEAANARAFASIREAPVPVIAAIRGICFGGGFGLAAAADLRLAAEGSRFAVPAARLGLAYPADAVQDIARALGPALAAKALYTAGEFSTAEALACGMLLSVETDEALDDAAMALARRIVAGAPLSVRASKVALAAALTGSVELAAKASLLGDATFDSADYREGRAAFADRRKPVFIGQ